MTSSLGVQLTPGQRCLLDLLQRKLLNTIQSYARLSLEKQKSHENLPELDNELLRLKEKIRRISARQKRFTLEIINGNGNNTIPKESFFGALGLVTKEALSKLNSKTNERRRRTTANPRFSHEAIQAKRALEPLQKRLEPRVRGENNKREPSTRRPQRHHQPSSNSIEANNNNNNNNGTNTTNNNNIRSNLNNNIRGNNNQQATTLSNKNKTNSKASNPSKSRNNRRNLMLHDDNESKLLSIKKAQLRKQIEEMITVCRAKKESMRRLERQNELIRKRGIEIVNAINTLKPQPNYQHPEETLEEEDEEEGGDDHSSSSGQKETTNNNSNNNNNNNNNKHTSCQNDNSQSSNPTEPIDIWIDMKCDESIDGLD